MNSQPKDIDSEMGKGYAIGMPIGLIIGFLLNNIGFGLVLGISLGAGFGSWLSQRKENALPILNELT